MKANQDIPLYLNRELSIENKLARIKQLDFDIKQASAEREMIKQELIDNHFQYNEEYKTERGLVLATYKSYVENRFNGKKFSEDFPDIYSEYKEEKTVFKFLMK